MHPDSYYHKWESSKQMELAVQGVSSTPGRAGKALCHSNSTQGKAIEILYLLLAICIAVATALIVVKLGKLSQGLAEAQLDRDTIRRDVKRNLSDHKDYLELKMSKEFNVFNSRLLNVSQGLAEAQLDRDAIRRDAQRNLSLQQDYLEIKSKELDEVKRNHDRLQEVLSRVQEELRNLTEFTSIKCPPGWQQFQKSCYFFSTSDKSWEDAKQFCTDHGSHLVIVNTEEEQTFLSNQSTNSHVYWLGLRDSMKKGAWRWVDGSLLSLSFWGPGEPNNAAEECGTLHSDGKWNDSTCSSTEHWICERQC
ncbi:CD209 antigen-like protein C isoform X6 [Chrysemys picta bellii]|uniref:CD209 antigen-like protein C isoform X6 n=1 Tax=Chrysemys picta bellii TaxID=8478 RepID=UPI0032B13BB7